MAKQPIAINGAAAQLATKCPRCGQAIGLQATVQVFGEPQSWHFWGSQGQRWKKCEGQHGRYHYVHFTAVINERLSHRLAWIEPVADEMGKLESWI